MDRIIALELVAKRAEAAITGLREWYGQDFMRHGALADCLEVEALVAALRLLNTSSQT